MYVNGEFSLTSRNIPQVVTTIFNAVAITDTTRKLSIDLTNLGIYSKLVLVVQNTLGVAVTINIEPKTYAAAYKYGTAATLQTVTVASSGFRQVYTASDITFLGNPISDSFAVQVVAQAASAPVTGSLTVLLIGTLS